MAFCTDAQLVAATTAANTQSAEPLPDHWDAIVPTANVRAYNRLRASVLGRGFTAAQFASWGSGSTSDGYDWNLRLGVLYAFLEASKGDEDRGRAYREEIKELLEELEALHLIVDGALVVPSGSNRVGYGDYDTTDDVHGMEDVL